ncbi:MAG: hypothetical protein ACREC9_14765 [Methylocella sp.]
MHLKALSVVPLATGSLTTCANFNPPAIGYDNDLTPATFAGDPRTPVKVVVHSTPLPLPGQLKPLPAGKPAPEPKDPAVRVATANEAARLRFCGHRINSTES